MDFREKYTTTAIAEKDKVQLSNDAYAIAEAVDELIKIVKYAGRKYG